MQKKSFSVLLSIYKKEQPDYLEEALNSIFNQTVKSDDIVLIEDGELTRELENVIKSMNEYIQSCMLFVTSRTED